MRVPIPSDWDGETWECYQIEWPKSDQWLGQLLGALTLYSRGRYWDEQTGSVIDAQAVGWEIYLRNQALTKCAGDSETITDETEQTARQVSGAMTLWEMECDEMPCIDISGLLKIENGNLYARDACCEWILIGSWAGADSVPEIDNPLYDPTADPPQTWYACGKAQGIITRLAAVMDAAWEQYPNEPWEFYTLMRGDFPDLSLDKLKTLDLWAMVNVAALVINESYVFNDTLLGLMICKLVVNLEDTPTVTDAEYDHVRTSIRSVLFDVYGTVPILGDIGAEAIYEIWDTVCDMVGKGDMKNIMLAGSANDAAECDCPEIEEEAPEDLDWFHTFDFTVDAQGFSDPGSTGNYVAGTGWESEEYGGYDIHLVVPGPTKTNTTGSPQTTYMTWARLTVDYCDPWVSGARETEIRLHLGAGDLKATVYPSDGAHAHIWTGYVYNTTANGASSNVEIRLIRDECGAESYKGRVTKLEIGGFGYDPIDDYTP